MFQDAVTHLIATLTRDRDQIVARLQTLEEERQVLMTRGVKLEGGIEALQQLQAQEQDRLKTVAAAVICDGATPPAAQPPVEYVTR